MKKAMLLGLASAITIAMINPAFAAGKSVDVKSATSVEKVEKNLKDSFGVDAKEGSFARLDAKQKADATEKMATKLSSSLANIDLKGTLKGSQLLSVLNSVGDARASILLTHISKLQLAADKIAEAKKNGTFDANDADTMSIVRQIALDTQLIKNASLLKAGSGDSAGEKAYLTIESKMSESLDSYDSTARESFNVIKEALLNESSTKGSNLGASLIAALKNSPTLKIGNDQAALDKKLKEIETCE